MSGIAELLAVAATPDEAIARAVAAAEAPDQLAMVLADEARLLRHPAIVGALFANPRAPMEVVNRAVAACVRGGVRVEQIPGFDEIAAALRAEVAPEAAGATFDQVLVESERLAVEDAADDEVALAGASEGQSM